MIRKLFFLLLTLSFLNANDYINIYVNKNHGFLAFLDSLFDAKYASKVPKKIYLEKYKLPNEKLKLLHKKFSRTTIYNYSRSKNLLEALYLESIYSKNLVELENRISKYKTSIKSSDISEYFKLSKELFPIYEKLFFNKSLKQLGKKQAQLESLINKNQFNTMVEQVAKFYGIKKENIGEFNVALYPITRGNRVSAYRIKNLESVGAFVNRNQNMKWFLTATILHEISHTLYFNSQIVKKNFSKKDKLIIEALATAIGAGWGYEKLTKRVAQNPWYNNKRYDKFAKSIFLKVKEYLESGKTLDAQLINYLEMAKDKQ